MVKIRSLILLPVILFITAFGMNACGSHSEDTSTSEIYEQSEKDSGKESADNKDPSNDIVKDPSNNIVLKITCGCKGRELQHCQRAAKEWEALTGQHVEIITLPAESNERLSLYQQLLRAESQDIDIFLIDAVWPGILANFLVDLNEHVTKKELSEFYKANITNNTVYGRLVAIPWYIDIGVFYYRKDLLEKYGHEIPKTWAELERVATDIQGKERMSGSSRIWGYVFQGKSYEGLTVNAVEWFCSAGGGIIDSAGEAVINSEPNRHMLKLISKWIGTIAPSGVLGYTEEEARGVFQSGNAIFMRNWPYVFALLNAPDCPLAGKVGVAPLPTGDSAGSRHAGTLGGWSLGVSKFSKHPEEAIAFVKYLTSRKEQKRRAIESGISPTRPDLYKDQEVLKAQPIFTKFGDILSNVVARPSALFGSLYSQASTELFNSVHSMIAGHKPIDSALKQLNHRLSQLLKKAKSMNRGK